MRRIITSRFSLLPLAVAAGLLVQPAWAQRTGNPERDAEIAEKVAQRKGNVLKISPDAPDRYTVVRGDTLWGISTKYLSDPWNWPLLWRGNRDQIKNPHLIYPGDVLVLDRKNGTLTVERGGVKVTEEVQPGRVEVVKPTVRAESTVQAVPIVPANVIEPFLARPLVLDAKLVDGRIQDAGILRDAPRVLGSSESGRVILGAGDRIFVSNLKGDALRWHVFRDGQPFIDPDNGEVLGKEAIFLGTVQVVRRGEPAEVLIQSAKQEILKGDRLVAAERQTLNNFTLKKPDTDIRARLMTVYGGVQAGGQYSVVTLNKGSRDGLTEGHVLALYKSTGKIQDQPDENGEKRMVQLPDEHYGLVTVFRVTERVSYALVMEAKRPLALGDSVRTP